MITNSTIYLLNYHNIIPHTSSLKMFLKNKVQSVENCLFCISQLGKNTLKTYFHTKLAFIYTK